MNRGEYWRVLGAAHAVRLMARGVATGGMLDEAIEFAAAAGPACDALGRGERMVSDEIALRAVRMLARLGDEDSAGAVAAHEPHPEVMTPVGSFLPHPSAPAPANTPSTGEESAPQPETASGSLRGAHASSLVETLFLAEGSS